MCGLCLYWGGGGREILSEFNISSNSKNQNTALGGATRARARPERPETWAPPRALHSRWAVEVPNCLQRKPACTESKAKEEVAGLFLAEPHPQRYRQGCARPREDCGAERRSPGFFLAQHSSGGSPPWPSTVASLVGSRSQWARAPSRGPFKKTMTLCSQETTE